MHATNIAVLNVFVIVVLIAIGAPGTVQAMNRNVVPVTEYTRLMPHQPLVQPYRLPPKKGAHSAESSEETCCEKCCLPCSCLPCAVVSCCMCVLWMLSPVARLVCGCSSCYRT
jgi:hypothetical protein